MHYDALFECAKVNDEGIRSIAISSISTESLLHASLLVRCAYIATRRVMYVGCILCLCEFPKLVY